MSEIKEPAYATHGEVSPTYTAHGQPLENSNKPFRKRIVPVIACGAGLFSDGYLNGVIGFVMAMMKKAYGKANFTKNNAQSNVGSITFAGTVVGMLLFGYTSDKISRKWSLFVSTCIVILFAILATASWGKDIQTLISCLVAFRFFLGIGIGGEYPAGSVACAESTGELKSGTRNRWFIMFTNVQIDFGFLVAAFVPMVVVLATGENHLKAAWRICLGLGIIPPLSLLYLRGKLDEPESYKQHNMAKTRTPYWLALKFYWFRLLIVATIWFIYDFSAYSFYIYMSDILDLLLGDNTKMWVNFGWSTLITFFYMPGCIAGTWFSDWLGPKKALAYGVFAQGIVGFIMTACYRQLNQHSAIGGFVIIYGLFLALGELGPGDNIGLLASKTSATPIRGMYYGIAAATGKLGAFVGNYIFPIMIAAQGKDKVKAGQVPFYVGSALAIFAGVLAFLLPDVGQDTIELEDQRFRAYLQAHGWDTSKMGNAEYQQRGAVSYEQPKH